MQIKPVISWLFLLIFSGVFFSTKIFAHHPPLGTSMNSLPSKSIQLAQVKFEDPSSSEYNSPFQCKLPDGNTTYRVYSSKKSNRRHIGNIYSGQTIFIPPRQTDPNWTQIISPQQGYAKNLPIMLCTRN